MNKNLNYIIILCFSLSAFSPLKSQNFGILPTRFDFKLIRNNNSGISSPSGPAGMMASNTLISGDCIYDEMYESLFMEELYLQFEDYDYLKNAPRLDVDALSEEERQAEMTAFNSILGNSMYYDSRLRAREERGRTSRRSELVNDLVKLRPDLINPLADKLDRDILIYFGAYGIHWLRRNQDPETVRYPEFAKGAFSIAAWVIDGNTGEILLVSSVSTRRRSGPEKKSVPRGFFMPEMIPAPREKPTLSERVIRNKVSKLLTQLQLDLEKSGLLE